MRIENPSRVDVAIKVAQQPFQQSCFSCSRFTGDDDEALAGGDAVTKRRKRFVIAGVAKEKSRVRRDIKRRLAQPEVILVHKIPRMTIRRTYNIRRIADRRIEFSRPGSPGSLSKLKIANSVPALPRLSAPDFEPLNYRFKTK